MRAGNAPLVPTRQRSLNQALEIDLSYTEERLCGSERVEQKMVDAMFDRSR